MLDDDDDDDEDDDDDDEGVFLRLEFACPDLLSELLVKLEGDELSSPGSDTIHALLP